MARINTIVGAYYKVEPTSQSGSLKSKRKSYSPTRCGMYLCQPLCSFCLTNIIRQFGLSNVVSVSFITTQIQRRSKQICCILQDPLPFKRYCIKSATCLPNYHRTWVEDRIKVSLWAYRSFDNNALQISSSIFSTRKSIVCTPTLAMGRLSSVSRTS